MDNQRTKMLGENLTHYRNLQENGSVNLIEFHTTDNRKFGIGNPDARAHAGRYRLTLYLTTWNSSMTEKRTPVLKSRSSLFHCLTDKTPKL